eukprot:581478-Prorocentrum_minimum.AAC.1
MCGGRGQARTTRPEQYDDEMVHCAALAQALKEGGGGAAWDLNHIKVYRLAEVVMDRIVRDFNHHHPPATYSKL